MLWFPSNYKSKAKKRFVPFPSLLLTKQFIKYCHSSIQTMLIIWPTRLTRSTYVRRCDYFPPKASVRAKHTSIQQTIKVVLDYIGLKPIFLHYLWIIWVWNRRHYYYLLVTEEVSNNMENILLNTCEIRVLYKCVYMTIVLLCHVCLRL